jgi:hypothetical protein
VQRSPKCEAKIGKSRSLHFDTIRRFPAEKVGGLVYFLMLFTRRFIFSCFSLEDGGRFLSFVRRWAVVFSVSVEDGSRSLKDSVQILLTHPAGVGPFPPLSPGFFSRMSVVAFGVLADAATYRSAMWRAAVSSTCSAVVSFHASCCSSTLVTDRPRASDPGLPPDNYS